MTTQDPAAASAAAAPTSVQTPNADPPKAPDPAPKAAADDAIDPNWLKGRLEREATKAAAKALKDAGFDSVEAAKAASSALKARADADKSADTKAAELKLSLDAKTQEASRLTEMAARLALGAMSSLTPEQQAAVKAAAGDDAAKQLEMIEVFKPTWAKAAAATDTEEKKDVTTAPDAKAPKGSVPGSSAPRAIYDQTREANPFAAATFGLKTPAVYDSK